MSSYVRASMSALCAMCVFTLCVLPLEWVPKVEALPSYARQTGLPCSGCHYTFPELNPAGRRFKLLGYVDKAADTKVITTEGGKSKAALDLLASLPLSVMLDTSFTSTKSAIPTTQNGSFEFPQDVSLFLSGAWTSHVGSFLQVTYDYQKNSFAADNTDIRYANKTKVGGKELIYGLDLNNNPTVEDVWNDTPAWGYPWIASDWAPTSSAVPIIDGPLAQDVAGLGAYAMWDQHLYFDGTIYRSEHVGNPQPNSGTGYTYNIQGVTPYWRLAWQQLTAKTQYEIGTYGMHMRSTPNQIVNANGVAGPENEYTDFAFDTQIDRTLFRKDVLSLRGTFIRENSDLLADLAVPPPTGPTASQGSHHLNTTLANAEYHFGNRVSGTFGWFESEGTSDTVLYAPAAVTGSATGNPLSAGYIANVSYWPWQNLQVGAQYTGYTRFNGGTTNYDGSGRNASGNDTTYLDIKFMF